ncbi:MULTISPECIES: DUF421 domain-containing protein [Pontibacillus]|uniref:DUF421 domain-containing protein n=1 Tax=Pontibacillus chungwhensis TaxID=265426 RepID=A0ABY8UXD5_9BACI|nr:MULTISPECIES: YetF domain-containing protein [Pontibacillus]MCD5325584.1 DUF421 domain-containing protein [Pontibacillus sp. HN14]WIF98167.1 DUF421 domain-containing protein [Pontibacillus chungwhensis]
MIVILKSILMITAGVCLLRFAGRKSISQMSLAQTVIMISIGSIIIQPIIETSIWRTIVAASVFVLMLILFEFLQLKFNGFEKWITGKSRIVIQNSQLQTAELRKLRLSVDQLEMLVRQQGITSLSSLKTATIEPNGQLGYELKEEEKPLTIGEFKRLIHPSMLKEVPNTSNQSSTNIFEEMTNQKELHSDPKLK